MIKEHFSSLASPSPERPRPAFDVPEHPGTRYAIVTDKETTATAVQLSDLRPARNQGSVGGYRDIMLDQLFADMLGDRLDELSQSANPPFLRAAADRGLFPAPRTRDEAVLQALVSNDGVTRGLDALVTELQRVARFGFTATELARAKQAMMVGYERVRHGESGPRVGEPRRRVHAQLPRRTRRCRRSGRSSRSIAASCPASRWPRSTRSPATGFPTSNRLVVVVGAGSGRRRPARPGAARGRRQDRRRRSGSRPTSTPAAGQTLMDAPPPRGTIVKTTVAAGGRHHRVDAVERRDRRAQADDAEGGSDPVPRRRRRAGRRSRATPISFPLASPTPSSPPAASGGSTP